MEKSGVYRIVYTKDRLPKEEGKYFTNRGVLNFLSKYQVFYEEKPLWWLEEIELPTHKHLVEQFGGEDTKQGNEITTCITKGLWGGYNYLLSFIKK